MNIPLFIVFETIFLLAFFLQQLLTTAKKRRTRLVFEKNSPLNKSRRFTLRLLLADSKRRKHRHVSESTSLCWLRKRSPCATMTLLNALQRFSLFSPPINYPIFPFTHDFTRRARCECSSFTLKMMFRSSIKTFSHYTDVRAGNNHQLEMDGSFIKREEKRREGTK